MSESTPKPKNWKPALAAAAAAWIIRLLGLTWRLRLEDPHGLAREGRLGGPVIWIFWHNRVAGMPLIYRRWFRHRKALVLTSASGDGEILARTMAWFKLGAVRGSSSRRGARALKELVLTIRAGTDVIITPDGPRGPRYHLQAGLVQLAALTGASVVPIVVEYSRYKVFKTWDAFRLPLPCSVVRARVLEPIEVAGRLNDANFEEMRVLIETQLRDATCEATEGA